MNKKHSFSKLFQAGISYEEYQKLTSERVQIKMDNVFNAASKLIVHLDNNIGDRIDQNLQVLCISHIKCKDSANAIPVIYGLSKIMKNWDFKIVLRDDFEEEVEHHYLTAGRKKVPMIIFADDEGEEIVRWVERSLIQYQVLSDLQDERLNIESYILKYRSLPEFKPQIASEIILNELVDTANRAASLIKLLPQKKKVVLFSN